LLCVSRYKYFIYILRIKFYFCSLSTDEPKAFAALFKQRRIELGMTQTDVGLALGTLFGNGLSQNAISSFENLKLSHKTMMKRRLHIEKWLIEMEKVNSNQPKPEVPQIRITAYTLDWIKKCSVEWKKMKRNYKTSLGKSLKQLEKN